LKYLTVLVYKRHQIPVIFFPVILVFSGIIQRIEVPEYKLFIQVIRELTILFAAKPFSETYKTTILRAGDEKALAQNIGKSYSGSEKAAKSRTCISTCIISTRTSAATDWAIKSKPIQQNFIYLEW